MQVNHILILILLTNNTQLVIRWTKKIILISPENFNSYFFNKQEKKKWVATKKMFIFKDKVIDFEVEFKDSLKITIPFQYIFGL